MAAESGNHAFLTPGSKFLTAIFNRYQDWEARETATSYRGMSCFLVSFRVVRKVGYPEQPWLLQLPLNLGSWFPSLWNETDCYLHHLGVCVCACLHIKPGKVCKASCKLESVIMCQLLVLGRHQIDFMLHLTNCVHPWSSLHVEMTHQEKNGISLHVNIIYIYIFNSLNYHSHTSKRLLSMV